MAKPGLAQKLLNEEEPALRLVSGMGRSQSVSRRLNRGISISSNTRSSEVNLSNSQSNVVVAIDNLNDLVKPDPKNFSGNFKLKMKLDDE